MTRLPSDRPLAAAERIAGEVGRHVLAAAQASLKALRELLAKFPATDSRDDRKSTVDPAPTVTESSPPTTLQTRATQTSGRTAPPSAELLRSANTLPSAYGSDRLVLLARDPHCLYAYWDLSAARVAAVRADGGSDQLRMVLRTYDVTQIAFDAAPPNRFQDFAVSGDARSLYAYLGRPASCFVAEVGFIRPDGAFLSLARSQPIWTPRTDQPGAAPGRWMTVGWSERREAGELVPHGTNGTAGATSTSAVTVAVSEPAPVTQPAPSSWGETAPASQRGSWSLVRGGLANETAAAVPLVSSDD